MLVALLKGGGFNLRNCKVFHSFIKCLLSRSRIRACNGQVPAESMHSNATCVARSEDLDDLSGTFL